LGKRARWRLDAWLLDSTHAPQCAAGAGVRPGATAAGQPPAEGGRLPARQAPTTPCRGRTRRPSTCLSNSSTPSRRGARLRRGPRCAARCTTRLPAMPGGRLRAGTAGTSRGGDPPGRPAGAHGAGCMRGRRLHVQPATRRARRPAARPPTGRRSLVLISKEDYLLVFLWCVVSVQVLDHQPAARAQAFPGTYFKFSTCEPTRAGGSAVLYVAVDRLAVPLTPAEAAAGAARVNYAIHAFTRVRGAGAVSHSATLAFWAGARACPPPARCRARHQRRRLLTLPLFCSSCRGAVMRLHMLPSGRQLASTLLCLVPCPTCRPLPPGACVFVMAVQARLPPSTPHLPFAPVVRS